MIDNAQNEPCLENLTPYLGTTQSYTSPPAGMGSLPRQNSIRVLFHGLMMGWFTAEGCYVVGSYNQETDHVRRVRVWERNPDNLIGDYVYGKDFTDDSTLKLNVISPLPNFKHPGKFEPTGFNRLSDVGDGNPYYRHHFRWALNFGKELYSSHRNKIHNKVSPLFAMNSGLLYTACRSIPLNKEENGQEVPLGRVAEFAAANIYFARPSSGDLCALLLIDGQLKNAFVHGRQYVVYWDNSCEPDNCVNGKIIDMTRLNNALVRPGTRFVNLKNGIDCDMPDAISEEEQKDIDIRKGLQMHSLGFEHLDPQILFDVSRFDPCGGGWIGE